MHAIVPIIIVAIICIQIFFFVKNLIRMNQFSAIFSKEHSWRLRYNKETKLVDGVYGEGNVIFESIINSINKYLGNNSGSVIDFGLLKDAVDRHCDTVENDIATQTPIPLYWGLAGTMAGVILGLWDLLSSNAILTLMGSSGGVIATAATSAAVGINALLSGVAWAMLASIIGILLTTANSLLFKRCKLKEENGKNSFLAWMQSELLPELPSDTSQALNNLVKNLNKFNNTFKENTSNLGNALNAVNQSYAIQADIIQAVHDMDVMKMAKANVRVLQELKDCTDKLEDFNKYLEDIAGYTDAIHRFETQFSEQADRLHILEEIRDFFRSHKSAIAKTTADADKTLQESLSTIKESTTENVNELRKQFVTQSEHFKGILGEEKEAFERFMTQMNAQFSAQMSRMPQLVKQLEEISSIPVRLDKLIDKIESSNSRLASEISRTLTLTTQSIKESQHYRGITDNGKVVVAPSSIPEWMKYTGVISIVVIALACILNIVTYFVPLNTFFGMTDSPATVIVNDEKSDAEDTDEKAKGIEVKETKVQDNLSGSSTEQRGENVEPAKKDSVK